MGKRAQPSPFVATSGFKSESTLGGLPALSGRKVGTTSNPHGPYILGYTRVTMPVTMGGEAVRWSKSQKRQAQFGSKAATRLREAGIASNGASATAP